MKLLLDLNISHKLVERISDIYDGAKHVREIGLAQATDQEIWEYAKNNGFIIVSKDEDFHHLSLVYGPPPKVIWICLGNCSTSDIESSLRRYYEDIHEFANQPHAAFLIVGIRQG